MTIRWARTLRRRLGRTAAIGLSGLASRGGPACIRRTGRMIGALHYWLTWPFNRRLRGDIARVLGVSRRRAAAILRPAFRDNDRAVFEIISLAQPACEPERMIDEVAIEGMDHLASARPGGRGTIVLGMHMGNGILMAARLARAGHPVHVVFRDPRRLPPGLLARSLERAGCVPVALDRQNPTRSFRRMLRILNAGGMLYVLMDQANKGEGSERRFLGKRVRMPSGIAGLAVRSGAPVIPIHVESARRGWQFRVHPPLHAATGDAMLEAMIESMETQIRTHPQLWAWHHRRWKRYHFES